MKFKHIYLLFTFLLISIFNLKSEENTLSFHLDAIVFKSDTIGKGRIDIYTVLPYQNLEFQFLNSKYISKYTIYLNIYDKDNQKVAEKTVTKFIQEKDYFESQGGSGNFDYSNIQVHLPQGNYKVKIRIADENSKNEGERTRQLNILDYQSFPLSISGLMILSSIEELNGRFKITPHLSDNVGSLTEGYFAFFEVYNLNEPKNLDFIYEVTDSEDKQITSGNRVSKTIPKGKSQQFIKVPNINKAGASYNLKIISLKSSSDSVYRENDIVAMSQRLMKSILTVNGIVRKDLDMAIRQLRYVASSKEQNYIEEGKNEDEKQLRFDQFWKNLDPSPNTDRNEAFDDYFRRVNYVNKNMRSYSDGWMTDKGSVYIVFGPPNNIESSINSSTGVRYERWLYANSKEYIFSDNSGFGDFRLIRPFAVTEKYLYRK